MFRICEVLVRIRIFDSRILMQVRHRIPAIFVSDLFLAKFLCFYFLKVHLHHSSKIKSHKEVTNHKESRFFFVFSLLMEGSDLEPDPEPYR